MAFGDALRQDGATVTLRADTAQFNADVEKAEAQWRESVGSMSRESLKLDLANDRLRTSLAKYGAESNQAKRATIALRDAEEQAARAADRQTRETRQLTAAQNQQRASVGGLRAAMVGYASAFVGVYGLVSVLRQAKDAASNLNEQQDFARRVFGSAFPVVENYARNALGLARDQAYEAAAGVGALLRPLGVLPGEAAKTSVALAKLAVDFASMRNARLEDVLVAIRAGLVGESEPLRRFSVLLSEARVQQVALAQSGKENVKELTNEEKVRARIAIIFRDGAQAVGNYRDTIDGTANTEREFQKNLRNTEILLGEAIRPAYTQLVRTASEWLSNQKNQEELQRRVNAAVEAGEDVVRGLAAGLRVVKSALEPVVDAFGGLDKAVEAALIVGLVARIRRAALSFGLLTAASATARTKMVADAAAVGAAWDAAARPRTGPAGAGGGRAGRFPWVIGFNAPTIVAGAVVATAGASGARTGAYSAGRYPRVAALLRRIENGGRLSAYEREVLSGFGGRSISELAPQELARLEANLAPQATGAEGGDRDRPNMGRAPEAPRRRRTTADGGDTGGGGGGGRSLTDVELDLDRARLTSSTDDDARYLRELRSRYMRQIRALEARERLTEKQKEALRALYGRVAAVQGELDGFAAEEEQKLAAAREEAAERRRRAREKAEERERARDEAVARMAERNAERINRAIRSAKSGPALIREGRQAREKRDPDALTRADFDRFVGDFLRTFETTLDRYAPNFSGGLQTHALEHLTRQQTSVLTDIATGGRFTEAPMLRRLAEAEYA